MYTYVSIEGGKANLPSGANKINGRWISKWSEKGAWKCLSRGGMYYEAK